MGTSYPPQVLGGGYQSVAFASSIDIDPYQGETVEIGTITGDTTINAPHSSDSGVLPASGYVGQKLTILATMGSSVSTVTFASAYDLGGATTAWGAGLRNAYQFVYNGSNWICVGNLSPDPYTP